MHSRHLEIRRLLHAQRWQASTTPAQSKVVGQGKTHEATGPPDKPKASTGASDAEWKTLLSLRHFIWPRGDSEGRQRVIVAASLMVASKGLGLGVPLLMKGIIDGLTPCAVAGAATSAATATLPLAAIVGYGIIKAAQSGCSELRNVAFSTVSAKAVSGLSADVFRRLHLLSLEYHLSRQTGALSAIVSRGTRGLQWLLSVVVFNVVPSVFEVGIVSGMLWYTIGLEFALINICTIAAYSAWTFWVTSWRTQIRKQMNQAETRGSALMVDSLINYETVKHFGAENIECGKYESHLAQYQKGLQQTAASLGLLNFGQQFIFTCGMTSMLFLCSQGVVSGSMTVGDLVMANALLLQLSQPLNWLGTMYSESRRCLVDLSQLTAILEHPCESPALNVGAMPLSLPAGSSPSLEFRNVSFGYPSMPDPLLKDVSLHVPAGSTLAIVGTSGSGKSTLFRLLFRFFDPTSGSIHMAGTDLRDITVESVREQIGVIPQDIVLFNASLRDNIAYGRTGASNEEIESAVRAASLDDVVASLPLGLDTVVGERGLKLSGGEKQRVAIARAFLRRPAVLLVDEGTASLDSETEFEVMEQLRAMSSVNRATTLVIAHRLSTVQHADQIAVIHDGAVAELGSHHELLTRDDGLYRALWQRQQAESAERSSEN